MVSAIDSSTGHGGVLSLAERHHYRDLPKDGLSNATFLGDQIKRRNRDRSDNLCHVFDISRHMRLRNSMSRIAGIGDI